MNGFKHWPPSPPRVLETCPICGGPRFDTRTGFVTCKNGHGVRANATDRAHTAEDRQPSAKRGSAARHIACVEIDQESLRRGGSSRTATCTCGWRGPERSSLELAVDDALIHEQSDFAVQRKDQ